VRAPTSRPVEFERPKDTQIEKGETGTTESNNGHPNLNVHYLNHCVVVDRK